jgi:hypothetical protein
MEFFIQVAMNYGIVALCIALKLQQTLVKLSCHYDHNRCMVQEFIIHMYVWVAHVMMECLDNPCIQSRSEESIVIGE